MHKEGESREKGGGVPLDASVEASEGATSLLSQTLFGCFEAIHLYINQLKSILPFNAFGAN